MLVGVDSVVLGVEDLDAGRSFLADFGLSQSASDARLSAFQTKDGSSIVLRDVKDISLPPAVSAGSTVREIVWAADSEHDLRRIAAELTKDREVHLDEEGILHSRDDDGYGIAFVVDRRRPQPPAENRTNIYGATPNRAINSTIDFHEAVKPTSIAHVVVFSPDVEKAMGFYVNRLGFRVSDGFQDGRGVFLRAPGSDYHHTLFIIYGERHGLHHIAYHVRDFTDVMNGGVSLINAGWDPQFGPGRHIMGANYFWYFKSPCGGAMELTADMDRVDDSWQPRTVPFSAQNAAAWSMTLNSQPA